MKKIHKKILRLQREKAIRVAKTLRYTNKSYVTLRVYDKAHGDFITKRCPLIAGEIKHRRLAQKVSSLPGSKMRNIITKILPFVRGKRRGNKVNRKKHQGLQLKYLAYDALRCTL